MFRRNLSQTTKQWIVRRKGLERAPRGGGLRPKGLSRIADVMVEGRRGSTGYGHRPQAPVAWRSFGGRLLGSTGPGSAISSSPRFSRGRTGRGSSIKSVRPLIGKSAGAILAECVLETAPARINGGGGCIVGTCVISYSTPGK